MTTKSSNNNESSFYVSRRSRRGVYVFVLACIILVYLPRLLLLLNPTDESTLTIEEISYFHEIHKTTSESEKTNSAQKSPKYKIPPVKFDPAAYSLSEWMYLGLSEKQTKVVMKFASRGIKNEEVLRQIFVIPEKLFYLIKDSIIYSQAPKLETNKKFEPKIFETLKIELNSANEEDLERLKGIGPYLARKIIEYRSKLGGFTHYLQLLEIYKVTPELIENINENLSVDQSQVKKLNINTCAVEDLKAHPYLNWNQANSIVKIRKQKGKYSALDQLKESVLIDEKTYNKILPYLTL